MDLDLDLVIHHIDASLSAIMLDKSYRSKRGKSSIKFNSFVEPGTSGFSELLEGISEGSKSLFSNQKTFSSGVWVSDARTVAVDILRGLSNNLQWGGIGLLAVAIVIERLDNISSNDRECVDLVKGMADLAKGVKQLHEINAHLHKDMREKMSEAVYLVITGAMICCSVIRSKKLSKFLLFAKIREELIFLRGQIDGMFRNLMFQVQLKTLSSFISYTSHQSSSEASDRVCLQSKKAEPEISSASAISLSSHPANSQQPIQGKHSYSFNTGCSNSTNRYQRRGVISRIIRGIGGGRKSAADEIYDRLVKNHGIKGLERGTALFPYREIRIASQDFHPSNCVGEGAFGSVYKGILGDGRLVAIKRPSENGKSLFVNEWEISSRLQHRNIVKVLGCCLEGQETLLVYEFVQKGSLESHLFDAVKAQILDWRTRLNIIRGVARGLAYVHEDCGIRIVNRDIKTSNILLDENFDPKIADFGLGRVLGQDQGDEDVPVAGTEGYIAPECISHGRVTDKADVFSFGIVVLEIVSGRRCSEYSSSVPSLLKAAWNLHEENRVMDLVDRRLMCCEGFDSRHMLRVILIGLLCTQEAILRPAMSKVLLMLSLSSEEEIGISTPTKPIYL